MTKEQIQKRMASSMARSLEAEGADFKRMQKIITHGINIHKS